MKTIPCMYITASCIAIDPMLSAYLAKTIQQVINSIAKVSRAIKLPIFSEMLSIVVIVFGLGCSFGIEK